MSALKLSIIVPVYNVERYLEKCLKSLCGLNIENEIIIINDGTKDGSLEIAEKFRENHKNENIKIYKTEKLDKEYEGKNGQIVDIINKKGPVVKVKNGALVLLEVKFQGKKMQRGADVINGRKMAIGECLK